MTQVPPQLAPAPPQMLVSNVIQLVNESDSAIFDMEYMPKARLTLAPLGQPGDRIFVNEEVAWYFLGKWWTNNDNPRLKERQNEYQRLRTLYGCYEDDRLWAAAPALHLSAYSPDGQRITTVVDDPDGVQGGTATQLGREMSLEAQVKVLQDTLLQMQGQIAAQAVRNADQAQPEPAVDTPATPSHPGATAPLPVTHTVGGNPQVTVPVAPPAVTPPTITPPAEEEEPAFGQRLEPKVQAIPLDDPGEQQVDEDAPPYIAHGPAPTGGRVSA